MLLDADDPFSFGSRSCFVAGLLVKPQGVFGGRGKPKPKGKTGFTLKISAACKAGVWGLFFFEQKFACWEIRRGLYLSANHRRFGTVLFPLLLSFPITHANRYYFSPAGLDL